MKTILTLLLFFTSLGLYAQLPSVCVYDGFEVLGNDTINRVIDDKKEGKWLHYVSGGSAISCFGEGNYCSRKHFITYRISEGIYKNNKRIGLWKWYVSPESFERIAFYDNNGMLHNEDTKYFHDKTRHSIAFWRHGFLLKRETFYQDGTLNFIETNDTSGTRIFKVFYPEGTLKLLGTLENQEIKTLKAFGKNGKEVPFKKYAYQILLIDFGLTEPY